MNLLRSCVVHSSIKYIHIYIYIYIYIKTSERIIIVCMNCCRSGRWCGRIPCIRHWAPSTYQAYGQWCSLTTSTGWRVTGRSVQWATEMTSVTTRESRRVTLSVVRCRHSPVTATTQEGGTQAAGACRHHRNSPGGISFRVAPCGWAAVVRRIQRP